MNIYIVSYHATRHVNLGGAAAVIPVDAKATIATNDESELQGFADLHFYGPEGTGKVVIAKIEHVGMTLPGKGPGVLS